MFTALARLSVVSLSIGLIGCGNETWVSGNFYISHYGHGQEALSFKTFRKNENIVPASVVALKETESYLYVLQRPVKFSEKDDVLSYTIGGDCYLWKVRKYDRTIIWKKKIIGVSKNDNYTKVTSGSEDHCIIK